jgi:hypothetical protein
MPPAGIPPTAATAAHKPVPEGAENVHAVSLRARKGPRHCDRGLFFVTASCAATYYVGRPMYSRIRATSSGV